MTWPSTRSADCVDAPLDLAHVGHEAIQALAVGGGQRAVEAADLLGHGIQQAQRLRAPRRALRVVRAVAEELLEQHLRIVLHRQRRSLALPRQRIAIGAAQPFAAAQAGVLDHQLQRWQRRVLAQVLRRHLVHRDAEPRLRAGGRLRAAEERGGRAVVVAGGAARTIGQRMAEVGDDIDVRAIGRQRLQDLAEGEIAPFVLRRPARHGGAVRKIDRTEAGPRRGHGRHGRHHRVQQRQRQRRARAAQQCRGGKDVDG